MTKDLPTIVAEATAFVAAETARLDKAYYDHHAARVLYNLNRRFEKEIAFEAITEELKATLTDITPETLEGKLGAQAHLLDKSFLWLLHDASGDRYDPLRSFQQAFLAQKLFQDTFQALRKIAAEKNEKRTNKRTNMEELK